MSDAANTAGTKPAMPLFYKKPVPVTLEKHKDLKIRDVRNYAYAKGTHAVPVVLDEVPALQGYFPLVFTPGENPAMIALVGLTLNQNLMVMKDGSWRQGWPIPAYVTRYPFMLVQVPQDNRLILVMEEDASVVSPDGNQPLFADGQGTKVGQDVVNYCAAYNRAIENTQALCKELHDRGLLVEQRVDLVTPDLKQIALNGFFVVDEQKFNALPDDVFIEWRKRNWVGIVYAHLLSMSRWGGLVQLMQGDFAAPGNAAA